MTTNSMEQSCQACDLFTAYPKGILNDFDGTCTWSPEHEPEPFWLKFEGSVKKTDGQTCKTYKTKVAV